MTGYPLKRLNFSNEKLQALLFAGITIYLIPLFADNPAGIGNYIVLLLISLFIDSVWNFIRYRKVLCSVSASITSAVIFALTPDISLDLQILAVAVSLIPGKHVWGGTGKNMFNPAVLGVFTIYLIQSGYMQIHKPFMLTPLIILFVPFVKSRMITAAGFLLGGLIAIYLKDWSFSSLSASGLLFLTFAVVTDPVTVNSGLITGIVSLISSLVLYYFTESFLIPLLFINVFSYLSDKVFNTKFRFKPLKIKKVFEVTETPVKEVIKNDNNEYSKEELLEVISKGEIKGLGGAGFDFYTKLKTLLDSRAERKYLIINGVECDPGLNHDRWITDNYLDEIDIAVSFLNKIVQFESVFLSTKTDYSNGENFISVKVKDYYPVGAEKILIKELLGISLNRDDIPASCGFLVMNVQTLLNVYKLINEEDIKTKYITVGNLNTKESKIVKVNIGESLKEILARYSVNSSRIYTGGGIMAGLPADEGDLVTDRINSIYYGRADRYKESPQCSKCNACNIHCPMGINVRKGLDLSDADKCIKCGSCSYVCPAGRNLSAKITSL